AGGAGRPSDSSLAPWREKAPLANLGDLVLGAFELREDDAYRATLRAGLISRSLVDELRPELRQLRAMLGGRQAPARRELADMLAEDLRGFLAHHHFSRGVVVCTIPWLVTPPARLGLTAADVWTALHDGADCVIRGVVYVW